MLTAAVQEAFVADRDQVVGVERFDVARHFVGPARERVLVPAGAGIEAAAILAARLIGQLPTEYRRIIAIKAAVDRVLAVDQVFYPIAIRLLELGGREKL